MRYRLASFATLTFLFPSIASACMTPNPYVYLVKGAYLFAFLGIVLALVLELFRYAVETKVARWWLRRVALGFAVFAVIMLVLGCVYQVLDQEWRQQVGTPTGAASQRLCP